MKKKRWIWMGFLILILMIGGTSGCSVKKLFSKEDQKQMRPDQAKTTVPSPQFVPPISGAVSEVSKTDKLTETRIPPRQAEVKTPAPIPTPSPPQPSVAPSQPPKPQESKRGPGVVFNFDNADLYEVIRVMADIMKINYLIDPKVKGVVNIHTSGQLLAEDVFPVFQEILKLNGATAVKRGSLYEIVPFGDAKKLYFPPLTLRDSEKMPPEEKYTIQIIPLKYIPVTEVSKMIKPFLSDGADIIEHPPRNILIIGDIASNVKKCLDMVALFDEDIFSDFKVRIYPIANSDAAEIAKEMERIFSSFEVSLKSARGVGITFTAITRINSLLVVSSIPNIFENVEKWLKELDRTPKEETKLNVFVYYVQNGKAKDLADVLKQIFAPSKKKEGEFKEKVVTPTPPTPRGVKPTPAPPTPTTSSFPQEEVGGVPEGEINIVVDETTNALIIRTYARDYKIVLETIKKLDLYPKQVLIEVFIAEVTLDDLNKFGLEWSKFSDSFTMGGKTYNYTIGMGGIADASSMVSGIRYTIADTAGQLAAAIHASANDNRLKIISSPHILASNNKEAKIQIGVSQPILSNTYTAAGYGTSTGVVEGTIEYKDVGIILSVTPRISDGGLVTLEINIEDSKVETTSLGSLSNVPVFRKKTAKTTLSIMERQTIVIGGLIEESRDSTKTGVPLLSKIPLLGGVFGYQSYDKKKTELVLLMTPHVIADLSQSNTVTREFREKVETIKREIEKKEKKEKKKEKK